VIEAEKKKAATQNTSVGKSQEVKSGAVPQSTATTAQQHPPPQRPQQKQPPPSVLTQQSSRPPVEADDEDIDSEQVFKDNRSDLVITTSLTSAKKRAGQAKEEPKKPVPVAVQARDLFSEEALFGSLSKPEFQKDLDSSSLFKDDDNDVVAKLESKRPLKTNKTAFKIEEESFLPFDSNSKPSNARPPSAGKGSLFDDDLFAGNSSEKSVSSKNDNSDLNIDDYIASQRTAHSGGLFD